jgi:Arc/MetJ-type ribon-helix-helix transcriptional regulator
MQVELTGPAQLVVEQLLAQGRFRTANEAVEYALELLLDSQPTIETLKAKLQQGRDDAAAGRVTKLQSDEELKEFLDDVKRRMTTGPVCPGCAFTLTTRTVGVVCADVFTS